MSLRTPDPKLVGNQVAMQSLLDDLIARATILERLAEGDSDTDSKGHVSSDWRRVLDSFRVLTISATASGAAVTPRFLVRLYEAATRAALFSGDLNLFNLFRSRLVRDVYPACSRPCDIDRCEYESLGVLFYGVVARQPLEVAIILRRVSASVCLSAPFRFALRAVQAVHRKDGLDFLRLYSQATPLPRSLLSFSLEDMKCAAYRAIIRSYMKLDAAYAESLFGISRRSIYEGIIAEDERLSAVNADFSAPVISLRPPRK